MKKIFNLILAAFALLSAASCSSLFGDDNGGNNNGGNNNGGSLNETTFVVEVSDITATSATVSVTPSNSNTYYFDVMDQSTINRFDSLNDFAVAYIDYLKSTMILYGYTLADVLSLGSESYTLNKLEPETGYYAFAVGVDADGKITSNVTIKAFTTLSNDVNDNPTSQNSFSINVTDITTNGATVSITPSNSDTYYFDVVEKAEYSQYVDSSAFAANYLADLQSLITEYGYTLADILSSGSDSYTYSDDLDAGTDYVAFAFGVSTTGEITTDVTIKEFATLSSGSGSGSTSQNTFAIAVSGVTSNSATVSVTPSNNDTYYFDVYEKDIMDQYGDINIFVADYVAYLKSLYESYGYTLADALSSGADSYTYDGDLDPNTIYYAFAFGVNSDGAVTTNVTTKTFTTEASGSTSGGSTTGGLNLTNLVEGGCTNYGDFYEVGATNWWIDLYTADYSEALVIEVQSALSATSCIGTYSFDATFAAGSAVSGFIYDQYLYGSYWARLSESNGAVSEYLLISDGSVSISKNSDNYVIALDATAEDGSVITASYSGELVEGTDSYSALSNGQKRKSFRITNINSFKKLGGKNIMLKPITKKLVPASAVVPAKMTIKRYVNIEPKATPFTINKPFRK